jgi:predicted N-acyltransferase
MADLQHRCFASIREIPRQQWDALWPPLAEGYDLYLSQEEAGIAGFDFFYLGLYADEQLVVLAPLFAARFNMGLAMDDTWRQRLGRLQQRLPWLLVFNTLFCGSPTSEKGVVAIHPDWRRQPATFRALDLALRRVARERGAWMIVFKDFMDADLETLASMKPLGWFVGDGLPTAALDLPFDSLDAYLANLSTGTRKDMKRKLKKTGEAMQIEAVQDIGHCIDEAYRLYMNVHDRGPMSFEVLTREFFLNFSRYSPDHTVYFLYWITREDGGRRLVGFNFCLHFDDRLIDKYIGMDYSVSRELNLYFVSFLNNVRWCIENGKQIYMLSQGGYEVKQLLGARLIPLRTMTRIVNPVINWIASRFA